MSVVSLGSESRQHNVGMGQIALVGPGQGAKAILGSCLGLVLFHRERKIAAVAHIVLPLSNGRPGPAGKFADRAIPTMLERLKAQQAGRHGLTAKIAGCANMFASDGPIQIGQQNLAAVRELLGRLSISVSAQHVGGQHGRRIEFDSDTGKLSVFVAGEPVVDL